jgi:hypothetical protein
MPSWCHKVVRVVVFIGLVACGAKPVAAPIVANHADQAPCSIDGFDSEAEDKLVVHLSPLAEDPIFQIVDANGISATWTQLPVDTAHGRARLEIQSDGLAVFGWASIAERAFVLGKRAVIVPGHVWAVKGSRVTVLGAAGRDGAAIAIATQFDVPKVVRTQVACDVLVDPDARPEPDDDTPVAIHDLEMCGNLDLYTAPDGHHIFEAVSGTTWKFDRREIKNGFEHLVGALGNIEFDGWAPVPGSGDTLCQGRAIAIRELHASVMLRDQATRTLDHDTAVFAGPGGPQIGSIKAGSELQILGGSADFVKITMSRRAVDPGPRGFYIRADHSGSPPPHQP